MDTIGQVTHFDTISTQDSYGDLIVSDPRAIKKHVKFTQRQLEALDELSELGVFAPFDKNKADPETEYTYKNFSETVRELVADLYERQTGKPFPRDMTIGNPNFYSEPDES